MALRDRPNIYVLLNGVPAYRWVTCTCLSEQAIILKATCWRVVCEKHHHDHDHLILDELELLCDPSHVSVWVGNSWLC